ncbi:MAG: acetyl-CoA carboxylase, carboxyltransferase subunit beta [Rhodospirillaceae bacterium]
MNWLRDFVRPKLKSLVAGSKEMPENLWDKCPGCGQMIFHRDLQKNLHVCTHCDHHLRVSAHDRMAMLFDDGAYEKISWKAPVNDPLKFKDRETYAAKLKSARAKTGDQDAIVAGFGRINELPVVIAALNFDFMGGSMGAAVGSGMLAAARKAVGEKAAFVVIPSSGGARMQEGILSLMQMGRTTIAVDEVKEVGLPYIVVLTDPTTGGVSASYAMLGDIHIAEPGAVIGFAGQRVIEQTIRETLPEGFQRAEYLLEHGMVDMVVPRPELKETLARVIDLLLNPEPGRQVDGTDQDIEILEGEILPPAPRRATMAVNAPGDRPADG